MPQCMRCLRRARCTARLRADGAAAAYPPSRRDGPPPLGERIVPQGARRDPGRQPRHRRRKSTPITDQHPVRRAFNHLEHLRGPRTTLAVSDNDPAPDKLLREPVGIPVPRSPFSVRQPVRTPSGNRRLPHSGSPPHDRYSDDPCTSTANRSSLRNCRERAVQRGNTRIRSHLLSRHRPDQPRRTNGGLRRQALRQQQQRHVDGIRVDSRHRASRPAPAPRGSSMQSCRTSQPANDAPRPTSTA